MRDPEPELGGGVQHFGGTELCRLRRGHRPDGRAARLEDGVRSGVVRRVRDQTGQQVRDDGGGVEAVPVGAGGEEESRQRGTAEEGEGVEGSTPYGRQSLYIVC
ncbi:hypothetical protein GCM10010357_26060 [Streptomyces luteireticuli]|uniref:Uncharacterized protein n=1 Tax=Streptomyces luteireticuli TaxID=173858 RepID=A0ABN0YPB6_9ACTN